jgi:hypothetical protein
MDLTALTLKLPDISAFHMKAVLVIIKFGRACFFLWNNVLRAINGK